MLKIAVSGVAFMVIFRGISASALNFSVIRPDRTFVVMVSLVTLMMVINWGVEAQRWKMSVPHEKISFFTALNTVLCGLALNWVIPFTLGDVAGRLACVKDKRQSSKAMLINRGVMVGLTGLYGTFSILHFTGKLTTPSIVVTLLIGGVGAVFFFSRKKVAGLGRSTLLLFLLLSILRYLIFTFQFYLLIRWFNPQLAPELIILGIGWIFFFRSFLPSLFGNFGVREASALLFFDTYTAAPSLILAPCLLIWFINTVIPSLYGAGSVFKLKLKIAQ